MTQRMNPAERHKMRTTRDKEFKETNENNTGYNMNKSRIQPKKLSDMVLGTLQRQKLYSSSAILKTALSF